MLVLLLSVVGTAYAADPDGSSPASAIQLTNSATGTITGTRAGAFKYYNIAYPGDNTVGTLTIWFSPGNTSTAKALFMKLWQSGKMIASSDAYTLSTKVGEQKMTFKSASKDPILLQLAYYESPDAYHATKTISYQLELKGLPTAAAAPAAPRSRRSGRSRRASRSGSPSCPRRRQDDRHSRR